MRRELNAFIAKCANEHFDDIVEAIADGHRYAATTIDAADGGVDIISDCRGGAAVTVQHADEENQRECPLLCEAIEKALPKWEDVKEEYEAEEEEEAEAEKMLVQARAEREANELKSASLTPAILKKMWIEKWDGKLPVYGNVPQIMMTK